MRPLYTLAFAAMILSACATALKGNAADGRYSSPSRGFACTLPITGRDLEIYDDVDSNGEIVRFQFPYGPFYRVEYFRINSHPVARIDSAAPINVQLQRFKENALPLYSGGPRIKSADTVLQTEIALGERPAYLVILRYAMAPPESGNEERGFLFFRTADHLVVMQYGPFVGVHDLKRLEAELLRFYGLCSFSSVG